MYGVKTNERKFDSMGMAASQARFLGLTARKNNVEFEGQQVNQQRTALSNQSANYYNDLLGMSVPIPPSVDDYTKTVYTFEDGALTNEITAMIAQNDGSYKISYLRHWTDDFSVVNASTSIINTSDKEQGPYFVGAQALRQLGTDLIEYSSTVEICTEEDKENFMYYLVDENQDFQAIYKDSEGKFYYDTEYTKPCGESVTEDNPAVKIFLYNGGNDPNTSVYEVTKDENAYKKTVVTATRTEDVEKDEYLNTLSDDQLISLIKEEQEYIRLLKKKYGADSEYMVRYVKNTSTETWNPYFYKLKDLQTANYDENGNSQSNINCYKIGSETRTEEVKAVPDCKVEKDSSGRYINLTMPQHDPDGKVVAGTSITYALTTQTVTDQEKYENAMNQYEYDKYEYDQAIQAINAKIEIIQSEDKNLELRLKQLDTEQKAISTELEAVGQVIQKNTESSFKTFG